MDDLKSMLKEIIQDASPWDIVERKGYGYEVDDPIRVKSIYGEYVFLKNICSKYKHSEECILRYIRRNEILYSEKLESFVEHFEVLFIEMEQWTNVFSINNNVYKLYDLYLCPYQNKNIKYDWESELRANLGIDLQSIKMPEGFQLRKNNLEIT